MRTLTRLLPILLLSATVCLPTGCSEVHAAGEGHRYSQEPSIAHDARLGDRQIQLLKLSYRAASKFPLDPHVKNRSRAQEEVAQACFQLDAPERALAYINGIENWRRGAGYADYAAHLAKHGDSARLRTYLAKALEEAKTAEDWRKHRVEAKVAAVLLQLGKHEQANALTLGLDPTEALAVQAARRIDGGPKQLESQLAWIDGAFAAGDLDQVQWALTACVRYYDEHFENAKVRDSLYERVQGSMQKAPRVIGLRTLLDLAEISIKHGAQDRGREILDRVAIITGETEWLPEDRIPLVSRTAAIAFAAGEEESAKESLQDLHKLYVEKRELIVDIFRCDALVPLAEAYWKCKDPVSAIGLYSLALSEALVNPNARPQADDLVQIGCSMARLGVDPGAEWIETFHAAVGQLDGPW